VATTSRSRFLIGAVAYVRMTVRAGWVSVRYAIADRCMTCTDSTMRTREELGPFLVTWLTCSQDNLEHAVTDEQASLVIRTGRGIYQSICGHQIIPTALSDPPGRRCARCEEICVENSCGRCADPRATYGSLHLDPLRSSHVDKWKRSLGAD
jgi:hypothetical protein